MQAMAVCVGLLLFSVTWAAPVKFQPQTVKTRQGCVEKQRANRMLNEEESTTNQGSAHGDLTASMHPEPTWIKGAENVEDALLNRPDQERYGAALVRSNPQPIKRPVTRTELRRDKNREKKPKSVPSMIPADIKDAKDHFKDEENQQRYLLSRNSSVKSKHTHQVRRSTHYLTHLPQIRKIPGDFEGSGSPYTQVRGDNDVPPFSGDGQHFLDIPGKGGAVGPGLDSSASHTGLSGSDKAEIRNPQTSGLGSNEIPERERHGGHAVATGDETAHRAGAAGVSLAEGGNGITGSTNFRELPGKEGNRVDAGSQNAHQGKVELHYPRVPSKEKPKGGSRDSTGSASYNEIPKRGKGSSRKDAGESYRNQVTWTEKQRFPGKGKSQGQVLPSHSLGNEIKSKGDSSNAPSSEAIIITHSRKNHYVLQGQNNSTRNKGMSQRRGAWPSRRPHAHRRFSPRRSDSSESSSDSSSESNGD
ncbi:matrix extracellular phosphoglycoprotein isoform X1 [Peromyscus californicus insignis]|uniref:matrix extracellular phosphoglycoprotein isoform X1 n=1 Tax=Peromyscus californicus insignis TaxID=564181 RepID=UPI0022A7E28A|nr:matrix extracellular phosphoglycoprotein isoform X1 [Peromyscus californicus insignis]